ELLDRRATVDSVDGRRTPVRGDRDRSGLEEGNARGPTAQVASSGLEYAWEQRRGVRRLLARQRVRQAYDIPAGVVRLEPEGIERRLPHERERDDLAEPGSGERPADPATQLLGTGQPAAGGPARQDARHRF